MTLPNALEPGSLYTPCAANELDFDTTAELDELKDVVGHPRALSALRYGIHVKGNGCNIYALGPAGVSKHDVVRRILEEEAPERSISSDWCYVFNVLHPLKPFALELPPGYAI